MSQIKAIAIGTRFGLLTVLSYAGIGRSHNATWTCKCDCGTIKVVFGYCLRKGLTRSCGHTFTTRGIKPVTFLDLSGKKFGRWTVLNKYEVRKRLNGKRTTYWLCRCECGTEKFVIAGQLTYGSSTKCKRCPRMKARGISSRNTVFSEYKKAASERGYPWFLSDADFDVLTAQNCFYCAAPPSNTNNSGCNGSFTYTGIDRMDNSRGYEIDNVVPCCRRCNRAKDVMSQEDFLSWAERVVNHSRRKLDVQPPQTSLPELQSPSSL